MYEFSRGPLVWIAFVIFFGGSLYRLISMIINSKKEKVVHPYMSWKYGLRSILHWVVPMGTRNMRIQPVFTVLSFLFHAGLILTPLFVLGHVMLWKESWGISWWTFPETLSNMMTIMVVITGVIFVLRRIADPTVRYVSTFKEYLMLLVVLGPFITGLMAYYQLFDYRTIITIHMWTGAIWLIAIPLTWLSHMFYFPFTRAYMGSEFGFVRHARDW